jgi:hypothetical protein
MQYNQGDDFFNPVVHFDNTPYLNND